MLRVIGLSEKHQGRTITQAVTEWNTLIYADGGSHNNGTDVEQGYGSFIVDGEEEAHRLEFGACTNNVAEYKILIAALEYCIEHDLRAPDLRMDSALVVNQVLGRWRVRQTHLLDLWSRASALKAQVHANLTWVNRDEVLLFLGH